MLAAEHLAKSYGDRDILYDVSVRIERGETVALLGPNGAGKSTLFQLLTGVTTPDRGRILLDGTDVTDLHLYERARLGLSYLPQDASLFKGLTVEQNILLVLEAREPDRARRRENVEKLLHAFGLRAIRDSLAGGLSGGERRRCEIARALATRPGFILLDEPFAGVDPIAVGEINDLIRTIVRMGIGVLITDHNVREALAAVDRGYVLESGRILAEGSVQTIVADPEVRRIYLDADFRL